MMANARKVFGERVGEGLRPRWWPAPLGMVAAGVVVTALAAMVTVKAPTGERASGHGTPALVIVGLENLSRGEATRDRLELLDPTRLFMPHGEVVAALSPEALSTRSDGVVGQRFAPALVYPEFGAGRDVLAPSGPETALAATVTVMEPRTFEGLTRADADREAVKPKGRAARVEIYRIGEAEPVAALDLEQVASPLPAAWRPLELSLLVDAAGAQLRPLVVSVVRVEDLDERTRNLIIDEALRRVRLRPGMYRVWMGP